MNRELTTNAHVLAKGRIERFDHLPAGHRIECLTGSLWITQDGDLRDIVIDAGDGFTFDRNADALVSALDDSNYLLLARCRLAS